MKTVEYRVRSVTRYLVTRYEESENSASSESMGEFDNEVKASNAVHAFGNSETVMAQPADIVITKRPNTPTGCEQIRTWKLREGWDDCPT